MYPYQLFESAENDVRRSNLAYDFINKLSLYLFKLAQQRKHIDVLRTAVLNGYNYPSLLSDDLGVPAIFSRIIICFKHSDSSNLNGSAAPCTGEDMKYSITIDANTTNLMTLAHSVSDRCRMVLHHELQHIIDYIRFVDKRGISNRPVVRFKKKTVDLTVMPPEDRQRYRWESLKVYHNDSLERNAFFHNMAEPLLQRLRFLTTDAMVIDFFDPISKDFKEYFYGIILQKHGVLKQHWEMVSEKARRRSISRLKQLFDLHWRLLDQYNAGRDAKYTDNSHEGTQ